MRSDDAGNDRQAESTAGSAAPRIPPPKALERAPSVLRLHARSVVFHLDHALLTIAHHAKPDSSAGRCVDARIRDKVGKDLAELAPVASGHHPVVDLLDHQVGRVHSRQLHEDVAGELREVDWLVAERPALVKAREEKQIPDEGGHACALLADATKRVVDRSLPGERSSLPELGDCFG
jgi:hypothetical protein